MANIAEKFSRLEASKVEVLSFVRGRSDLWAPDRSGDYAQDCSSGRSYARELLEYMQLKGQDPLLGHVVQAITAGGVWDGVEIGFFAEISRCAIAGH